MKVMYSLRTQPKMSTENPRSRTAISSNLSFLDTKCTYIKKKRGLEGKKFEIFNTQHEQRLLSSYKQAYMA